MKGSIFNLIALIAICISLSQTQTSKYTLVITNANIVDLSNNKIIPGRLIAISGNTIEAVDRATNNNAYKAYRYIDLAGKFVIPGLWDMHIHLRGGDSLIGANKKMLILFLAYGVTTVRECGGDITPSVLLWKKQIQNNNLDGPGIFTSGPKIDGAKAFWAGSLEVETAEQVSKALDSLQKLQVDFAKIYDSKISREAYLETISQAHRRSMKITGHMPFTVELIEGIERGLDGSEHIFNVFKACSDKEDSMTNLIREREHTDKPMGFYASLPAFYNTYDEMKAAQLFRYLAQKKFTVDPTLYVIKTDLADLKYQDHSHDSLLSYIDPKIAATYLMRVDLAKRQSDESIQFMKRFVIKCGVIEKQMVDSGVNIVAGSDCGAFNSFVYPGASLHEELKIMVASGLTPVQALRTATVNGAKFMGIDNFYGSIQKGKSSNLVVLNANPLSDIKAIDQIDMVLANGKLYTRIDLNSLLQSIKNQ